MGYGGRKRPPAPEIMEQFARAMDMVDVQNLIDARGVLWVQKLSLVARQRISTVCGLKIPGSRVFHLMPQATHVVLGLGTIGNGIEGLSRKYLKSDDSILGVMLDSIGSAAVDCLTEEISRIVRDRAALHSRNQRKSRGGQIFCRGQSRGDTGAGPGRLRSACRLRP